MDTLAFDQVHLGAPDPEAAARWYVDHLGATPGDHVDRVAFGGTRVIVLKNEAPAPSHGGAIDHFALAVADVPARVRALAGSGMRLVEPAGGRPGLGRFAYIDDPWGARIQLVEEPGASGVHHVHLRVPDPGRARRWYLDRCGGTPATFKGQLDGIRYGDVWLFIDAGAAGPSRGRAIDHVGWRTADLVNTAAQLRGMGVTFTTDPKPGPPGPHSPALLSFAEDPWGVKIELLQRRADLR